VNGKGGQSELFALPPRELEPHPPSPELVALGERLPPLIRLGTMNWTYPGWVGSVYAAGVADKLLAAHGLTAYEKHPLFGAVEIDRSYYDPLAAGVYRGFAAQVRPAFRFLVKAHEECVVLRFPLHGRYGKKRGEHNPRFLDAAYATERVVAPLAEGLGDKAGALLFQFPPQDVGRPEAFADRLHDFLSRLPKVMTYAVELRNAELLTARYGAALSDAGAVHCYNVWKGMPPILTQARLLPPATRRPLVIRWLYPPGDDFEDAANRYAPFNRLVDEDTWSRDAVAHLAARAHAFGVPTLALVDNKAEGSSPESVVRLARTIVSRLESQR
jgi:uncharacterized protein YecE (DUF72 family)